VLVFDESHCFRDERQRWLYTALTRAADQVMLFID
jgi:ATP-dependent exoDNAse (exonuclease V) beta subunit